MRYFVSVFQFSVLRCLKTKPQLLLGGELLTERCRTDDLMPDLPVPSLPPCPKFWGWMSSSIVLSQMVLGRPMGLLQSDGGRRAAEMTR